MVIFLQLSPSFFNEKKGGGLTIHFSQRESYKQPLKEEIAMTGVPLEIIAAEEEPLKEKLTTSETPQRKPSRRMNKRRYIILLLIQGWASFLTFGFLPSLQSYSCLPYGSDVLHLSVTLCGIAYPASCTIGMFITLRRLPYILTMTITGSLLSVYITYTAATSPNPPLVDTVVGNCTIVFCWVATFLLLSYVKTVVTVIMAPEGESALFWTGALTQAGAVLGSVVLYVPIYHFNVFVEKNVC